MSISSLTPLLQPVCIICLLGGQLQSPHPTHQNMPALGSQAVTGGRGCQVHRCEATAALCGTLGALVLPCWAGSGMSWWSWGRMVLGEGGEKHQPRAQEGRLCVSWSCRQLPTPLALPGGCALVQSPGRLPATFTFPCRTSTAAALASTPALASISAACQPIFSAVRFSIFAELLPFLLPTST